MVVYFNIVLYMYCSMDERFQSNCEVLHLDVWNWVPSSDNVKEVKDKLKKLNDVKDTKGIYRRTPHSRAGEGNKQSTNYGIYLGLAK